MLHVGILPMSDSTKQIVKTGHFLVLAGIAITAIQGAVVVYFHWKGISIETPMRGFEASGPGGVGIDLRTTYPGLVMCGLGVFLQIVTHLSSRPWKTNQQEHKSENGSAQV